MRKWVDITGKYQTIARLVEIRSDAVRLERDNGGSVLVAVERLSGDDRQYVDQCSRMADRDSLGRLASLSMAGR